MASAHSRGRTLLAATLASAALLLPACGNIEKSIDNNEERAGLAGAIAAVAGRTPTTDLQQTYYLGIFDPRDQIRPAQFYRIRVSGQAGAISSTKYASGWVRAELIDSLSTVSTFDKNGIKFEGESVGLKTGRRMVLFGPEGFREAPANHRLVIAMGSDPEKFFQVVDETLGLMAAATQGSSNPEVEHAAVEIAVKAAISTDRLRDMVAESARDFHSEVTQ